MATIQDDPERGSRMRTASAVILALSGWLVLSALALEYGESGGASHNAVIGIFLIAAAVPMLRNPFGSALFCYLTAAGGVITAAAPFLYEYQAYTLSMASSMWTGLVITLLSVFMLGEALQLNQPLTEHEPDTAPTARAEPQD